MLAHKIVWNQGQINFRIVLGALEIQKLHSKLMRQRFGHVLFATRLNLYESLAYSLAGAFGQIQSLGDLILGDRLPLQ